IATRNNSGPFAAVASHAAGPNRNKTITNCLSLGRIFSTSARFFRPPEQEVDAAFDVRIFIVLKVQLRDMPEAEPHRQLVTQIAARVVEGCQRFLLFPLTAVK